MITILLNLPIFISSSTNKIPGIILSAIIFLGLLVVVYQFLSDPSNFKRLEGKPAIIGFILLLCGSFLLRIFIAPLIHGYPCDIASFKAWADLAATKGLSNFYSADFFIDYPPGYVYILFIIGSLRKLFSLGFDSAAFIILLKTPAMLADIASSIIIFRLAGKKLGTVMALALSALYVINPAVIFNSAIYGQIDSFFTLFIVLMLVFLYDDRIEAASIFFTIALLIKPQALIFAPIGMFALIEKRSLRSIILCLLCMVITLLIVILPFAINKEPLWIFKLYSKPLGLYPYASVNASNFFALVGANGIKDSEPFLFFSYQIWGFILTFCSVCYCAFLYFVSRHKSKIFFTAMFIIIACFVLCCRMHERYIFPAVILAITSFICTKDKRLIFLFGGLTATAFLNQAFLLEMVLTSGSTWFQPNHLLMRILSLINIGLLIFAAKVGIDIYLRDKIKLMSGLDQ